MRIYYYLYRFSKLNKSKTWNNYINDEKQPGVTSKECVSCGYCEKKCPQHLKIRDMLKKVEPILEAL